MHLHVSLPLLSLLGLALHANAQGGGQGAGNSSAAALLGALQGAGLTSLAGVIQQAAKSEAGQRLVTALLDTSTNYTVFAPDNAAFQAPAVTAVGDNPDVLANILSYHVLAGNYANTSSPNATLQSAVAPGRTIGRTLLTNTTWANLEGGKGQFLAWTRNTTHDAVYFLNQSPQNVVRSTTALGNILLNVISGVLLPPAPLSDVLEENNITALPTVLNSLQASFYGNSTPATLLEGLESEKTKGFTLFAPNDAAFAAIASTLDSLKGNTSALLAILGNHLVNGTTAVSPVVLGSNNSNVISESGQSFSFSANATGAFVTSGNSTAKIVKPDIFVQNGVVHIIDAVLANTADDDSKGANAYASATAAAASSVTATGPVTAPTSASGNGNGGNSGGNQNAAARLSLGNAALVGVVGWAAVWLLLL